MGFSLAALASLRLYPRESLPVIVDCFTALPGYVSASGSAHMCSHVHRLGDGGGTLCWDPDMTPKIALHPITPWLSEAVPLTQCPCSCQVASSHPKGRKSFARHMQNITEKHKTRIHTNTGRRLTVIYGNMYKTVQLHKEISCSFPR